MATEVTRLTNSQRDVLDSVLRPHLSLDTPPSTGDPPTDHLSHSTDKEIRKRTTFQESNLNQSSGRGAVTESGPGNRPDSVTMTSTVANDNKKRPAISRKISEKFISHKEPPPPPSPDPNSEAKSVCIRRMQSRLECWNQELQEITDKKIQNDDIVKSELDKRDEKIAEMTEKYNNELSAREKAEQQRNGLASQLRQTSETLADCQDRLYHFETQLRQYTQAYQEADERRNELEQTMAVTTQKLDQSEGMRRRLHEQVTELQGQLAIEEQRSKFCTLL